MYKERNLNLLLVELKRNQYILIYIYILGSEKFGALVNGYFTPSLHDSFASSILLSLSVGGPANVWIN